MADSFEQRARENNASKRLAAICEKIDKLCARDKNRLVHGASEHRYRPLKPVSEVELHVFQDAHHIILPDEYAEYISKISCGGPGHGFGLLTLKESERQSSESCLAEPFPNTAAWNLEPEHGEDHFAFEERYCDPALINGALAVFNLGCGMCLLLIVTGPECGNVWLDDRANDQGLTPCNRSGLRSKARLGFFDMYEQWLSDAFKSLRPI